jgi:hypothetical protein
MLIKLIKFLHYTVFCGMLLLPGCSSRVDTLTGGGTDIGNGKVSGKLIDARNGFPASFVPVRLSKSLYDPANGLLPDALPLIDTTDISGNFSFNDIEPGSYSILAVSDGNRIAYHSSVTVNKSQAVDIGSDSIRNGGSIRINLPDSGIPKESYFYIPGTSLFWKVDSAALASHFLIASPVPSIDRITLLFYSIGDSTSRWIIASEIEVEEDSTLEIEFSEEDSLKIDID